MRCAIFEPRVRKWTRGNACRTLISLFRQLPPSSSSAHHLPVNLRETRSSQVLCLGLHRSAPPVYGKDCYGTLCHRFCSFCSPNPRKPPPATVSDKSRSIDVVTNRHFLLELIECSMSAMTFPPKHARLLALVTSWHDYIQHFSSCG